MRNLKRDGDYYALKKGSVQSWARVIDAGGDAIKARLDSAWGRMGPMDLSDVGYDAFLANGERQTDLGPALPGGAFSFPGHFETASGPGPDVLVRRPASMKASRSAGS